MNRNLGCPMGFHRRGQPQAFTRAQIAAAVTELLAEEVAAGSDEISPGTQQGLAIARTVPIGDHDCINLTGHAVAASCGWVGCRHCGKAF